MRSVTLIGLLVAAFVATVGILEASAQQSETRPATTRSSNAFQIRLIVTADETGEPLADPLDKSKTLLVSRDVVANADDLAAVGALTRDDGTRGILIVLTKAGGDRLQVVTGENIGRRMAIVLEGEILIAPTIRAEVTDNIAISFGDGEQRDAVLARLQAVVPEDQLSDRDD